MVFLCLTGCQQEELKTKDAQQILSNTLQLKLKIKNYSELSEDARFTEALQKILKTNQTHSDILNRTTMEAQYGFTIDSSVIKEISYGNYISYTFLINRDETDDSYFENLLVEIDSLNNTSAKIVKYLLNSEIVPSPDDASFLLDADIEITDIDYDNSVVLRTSSVCVGVYMCPYGGIDHPAGNKCIAENRGDLYLDTSMCNETGGGDINPVTGTDDPNNGGNQTGNPNDPMPGGVGANGGDGNPHATGTVPPKQPWQKVTECMPELLDVDNAPLLAWLMDPLNKSKVREMGNYLSGNACSEEAQEEIIETLKSLELTNGMEKQCQALEVFRSVYRINSIFTNNIKNYFLLSNDNNLNLQDWATGQFSDEVPVPMPANVGARVLPEPSADGTIILQFNNTHLDTATTLGFVNTFYHELVHAYILRLYHSGKLLNEFPAYTDLKAAMDNFFINSSNTTISEIYDKEMHEIYIDFIDRIAQSIVAYCEYNNINGVDLVYAKKLVWGGLNGYDVFNDNLTPAQRLEAQTLLAHENFNNTSNAKGTKTCD